MTKSVIDNIITLKAMEGEDKEDIATKGHYRDIDYIEGLKDFSLKNKRIGVSEIYYKYFPVYKKNVDILKSKGAKIIQLSEGKPVFQMINKIMPAEISEDLSLYFKKYADPDLKISSIKDVIDFNMKDTLKRIPYNQKSFELALKTKVPLSELNEIKKELKKVSLDFFSSFEKENLDVILSINNYACGYSAGGNYPILTVPMGNNSTGELMGLSFIVKPFEEKKALEFAYYFEKLTKHRKQPEKYKD